MTKMNDALLNTEATYKALQPFASVEELNENTKAVRAEYGDQMTRATYDVLDVLARYACKFPGVCFLAKSKIAELIGVSRRTVIRACKLLADLGIIAEFATKRAGGDRRQSSNAIVFIKQQVAETSEVTPDVTPECHAINTPTNTPLKANTNNTYDTEKRVIHNGNASGQETPVPNPHDKSNLKDSLPSGWYDASAPYARDYSDLYSITGVLFKAKHGTSIRVEDYVDEFGTVLRKAWTALKHGKVSASKWHAYLFAAFRRTAQALERNKTHERMGGIFDEYLRTGVFS